MRRNLQRYKLRREYLINILKENGFVADDTLLSENGNRTTFETYRLRAKAATEEISLHELARVLLMINKKRGYKSSRKAKSTDEGQLIDGMEIAKRLYEENLTPGQLSLMLLEDGKKHLPDFYRSDLQSEFDRVWDYQKHFYDFLTDELKEELKGKNEKATRAICAPSKDAKDNDKFVWRWKVAELKWNEEKAVNESVEVEKTLVGEMRKGNQAEQKIENYKWRVKALSEKISPEQLIVVFQKINGQINSASGYLGDISDRSKELYFNKMTVGQYQMAQLDKNPNYSLKNQVFYRQDYLNEFEVIWETQAKYHKELTPELKKEIRDVVIFYQRPLKSQKGLISFCEFESRETKVEVDGKKKIKTIGSRVCPKSSPLFQEFKIWQILNNVIVTSDDGVKRVKRELHQEEKEKLFEELSYKDKLSKTDALKILFGKNAKGYDLNYKDLEGNRTQSELFKAYCNIIELSGHDGESLLKLSSKEKVSAVKDIFDNVLKINTDILVFNSDDNPTEQSMYSLWHLLYSFEGDNSNTGDEKLIEKLGSKYGFSKEYAKVLAGVVFQPDYGSLSTKAIRKILPHLKDGNVYSVACEYAGYRHSKKSLTKEELQNKVLKDRLELLPRNSLRNTVVEKILNQMVNVVNGVIDTYGKPDEIRIELARELKKSAKERAELSQSINETTRLHEEYVKILQKEFGLTHVSRNDIIRYKLYLELKLNGFKTLYSNTYIPQEKLFSKEFDIEHIIPKAKLFDDSFSNKTLEARDVNLNKSNATAYDFVKSTYGEERLQDYVSVIDKLYKNKVVSKTKRDKLLMKEADIPSGFIDRDLRDSQYIAKKAREILEDIVRFVVPTTGSVTDRLREDWQLVDVMQELNWNKYDRLGLTEVIEGRDGQKIKRIKDWTKRNDHRHHAMDALTIAFTKRSFIQYLNNLNARVQKGVDEWIDLDMVDWHKLSKEDRTSVIYGIEKKELSRDSRNKLRFNPPMENFRSEAKRHLESIIISQKAKNKVVTQNVNKAKNRVESVVVRDGEEKRIKGQMVKTPRGQLHEQTIYGQNRLSRIELNDKISKEQISLIVNQNIKNFIQNKVKECGSIKKAFSKENIPNIIYKGKQIKYLIISIPCFTQRVDIQKFFTDTQKSDSAKEKAIKSIVDLEIQKIIKERLEVFEKDYKKAFSNLDENPIWLNKEKGIAIKRVKITGISNAIALHDKRDKDGNLILDEGGKKQPVDYVSTGNNHHVAVYRRPELDKKGAVVLNEDGSVKYVLEEQVVSFFEATTRANLGYPIIDKDYKKEEGWEFMFTMKQNEYFVFPRYETVVDDEGNEKQIKTFDPKEIDLLNPDNYALISPNLFRVQKFTFRDYWFRHHLETVVTNDVNDLTYKRIRNLSFATDVVKVRVNHIGQIVSVGEY